MTPHDVTVQALAKQVAKLEAQNRRFRRVGIAALIVVSALAAMGQAQTNRVLEANELILRDTSGTVRARLSVDKTNKPTLTFYREKNLISASFAGGDEPFLLLNRAGTNDQIELEANSAILGLALYEKEIRAGLSVQHGTPGLEFYDESGHPQASIELNQTGPFIMLGGSADKTSSMLWADFLHGNSGLSMFGSAGTFRVDVGEEVAGPSLEIKDKEGYSTTLGRTDLVVPSSGRKERTPAASLVLFGKDKNVLWSAP